MVDSLVITETLNNVGFNENDEGETLGFEHILLEPNDENVYAQFYEWIINAEKVKLVFLSGTPIINKPNEIGILFNMLCANS